MSAQLTASQIVHCAAGAPRLASCDGAESVGAAGDLFSAPGPAALLSRSRCWLCGGEAARSAALDDWLGDTFTSHNRARAPASDRVCEACVFLCGRLSPVPGRPAKEGKNGAPNYRNFSHLYDAGASPAYLNASKGEKPAILSFLRREKCGAWFAAIADTGQKHVIPFAPVNPAGARSGIALFEEREIIIPSPTSAAWALIDDTIALLTAGATKEEIGRGDYGSRAWQLCGPQVRAYENAHGRNRGCTWFDLSLWLSQRDEAVVGERMEREKIERAEKKKVSAAASRPAKKTRAKNDVAPTVHMEAPAHGQAD